MRHHQRVTRVIGQEIEDQEIDPKIILDKKKAQELLDKRRPKVILGTEANSENVQNDFFDAVSEETLNQEVEKPKKKVPPKKKKETTE